MKTIIVLPFASPCLGRVRYNSAHHVHLRRHVRVSMGTASPGYILRTLNLENTESGKKGSPMH